VNDLEQEPPAIRCRECWRLTSDGKPYCPRHVLSMPYVTRLREDLRARARFERPRRWVESVDVFSGSRLRTVGA